MKRSLIFSLALGVTALASLAVWCAVDRNDLHSAHIGADTASRQALEEAVVAAEDLNEALMQSLYADDGAYCAQLCSRMYADGLSALTALSVLPFETAVLEDVSALFNSTADYAFELSADCIDGFSPEQRETLRTLSQDCGLLLAELKAERESLNNGEIRMDHLYSEHFNVGSADGETLSDRLSRYEDGYTLAPLSYSGRFAAREQAQHSVDAESANTLLRSLLHTQDAQLACEYADGRIALSSGDAFAVFDSEGLLSLSSERLVYESRLSEQELLAAAQELSALLGLHGTPTPAGNSGYSAVFRTEDAELRLALDDASLLSFSRLSQQTLADEAYLLSKEEAQRALWEELQVGGAERSVLTAPNGDSIPAYRFSCISPDGQSVQVLVRADNGRTADIRVQAA